MRQGRVADPFASEKPAIVIRRGRLSRLLQQGLIALVVTGLFVAAAEFAIRSYARQAPPPAAAPAAGETKTAAPASLGLVACDPERWWPVKVPEPPRAAAHRVTRQAPPQAPQQATNPLQALFGRPAS